MMLPLALCLAVCSNPPSPILAGGEFSSSTMKDGPSGLKSLLTPHNELTWRREIMDAVLGFGECGSNLQTARLHAPPMPGIADVLFGTLVRRYPLHPNDPLQLLEEGAKAFRLDSIRYTDLVSKFRDQERLMVAFILEQIGSEAKIALRANPQFQRYLNDASSVPLMALVQSTFSGATNAQSIHQRTIQGLSVNMGSGTHPAYIQKIYI